MREDIRATWNERNERNKHTTTHTTTITHDQAHILHIFDPIHFSNKSDGRI